MERNFKLTLQSPATVDEAEKILRELGTDAAGVAIMREKMIFRAVKVEQVPLRAAIILKQTFLAKGGEVATTREVAGLTAETSDVILMGTLKQFRLAIGALKGQPFGLKKLAGELERFLYKK